MKLSKPVFILVCLIILASSTVACGQSQPKIVTIGVINRVPGLDPVVEGFKSKMTELGYTDGKNIKYIYEGAITDPEKVAPYIQKLIEADVDLILGITTEAAVTAQQASADLPIIFVPVINPVDAGLVENLTQPGRNATGITNANADPRRLQWLLEIDPRIEQVYVPYNPGELAPSTAVASIGDVAEELNVELVLYEISGPESDLEAMTNIPEDVDAIFLVPDNTVIVHTKEWAEVARQKQLPISTPQVFPGALTSFTFDSPEMGQQAARLADQVLRGADPGDLPVENAEFFLTIDMTTANAIGLEIPDAVLEQAHTLIRDDS